MGSERQGVGLDEFIFISSGLWHVLDRAVNWSPPADDYDQMEEDLEDQVVR